MFSPSIKLKAYPPGGNFWGGYFNCVFLNTRAYTPMMRIYTASCPCSNNITPFTNEHSRWLIVEC